MNGSHEQILDAMKNYTQNKNGKGMQENTEKKNTIQKGDTVECDLDYEL